MGVLGSRRCNRCSEPLMIGARRMAHTSMMGCRDAVQRHLARFTDGLNDDEQRLVERIAGRLRKGRRTYGPWSVAKHINYRKEITDEFLDVIVYLVMELVSKEGGKG
jgi:hypothetical protein